jgi:hypothetical protein
VLILFNQAVFAAAHLQEAPTPTHAKRAGVQTRLQQCVHVHACAHAARTHSRGARHDLMRLRSRSHFPDQQQQQQQQLCAMCTDWLFSSLPTHPTITPIAVQFLAVCRAVRRAARLLWSLHCTIQEGFDDTIMTTLAKRCADFVSGLKLCQGKPLTALSNWCHRSNSLPRFLNVLFMQQDHTHT